MDEMVLRGICEALKGIQEELHAINQSLQPYINDRKVEEAFDNVDKWYT